jgi:hypothetical protein
MNAAFNPSVRWLPMLAFDLVVLMSGNTPTSRIGNRTLHMTIDFGRVARFRAQPIQEQEVQRRIVRKD